MSKATKSRLGTSYLPVSIITLKGCPSMVLTFVKSMCTAVNDEGTHMLVTYSDPSCKPARACVPEVVDWRDWVVARRSGRASALAAMKKSRAE
jgi:hypothetical protein